MPSFILFFSFLIFFFLLFFSSFSSLLRTSCSPSRPAPPAAMRPPPVTSRFTDYQTTAATRSRRPCLLRSSLLCSSAYCRGHHGRIWSLHCCWPSQLLHDRLAPPPSRTTEQPPARLQPRSLLFLACCNFIDSHGSFQLCLWSPPHARPLSLALSFNLSLDLMPSQAPSLLSLCFTSSLSWPKSASLFHFHSCFPSSSFPFCFHFITNLATSRSSMKLLRSFLQHTRTHDNRATPPTPPLHSLLVRPCQLTSTHIQVLYIFNMCILHIWSHNSFLHHYGIP